VRKQTFGFQPDPDIAALTIFIDTKYDEYGRKYQVSRPYFKDATNVYWTEYQYDLLGRVKKVITPANKQITSEYFVGKIIVTNPLGQSKTTFFNGQGKPIKVVDNLGQILEYTYDAAGRLLTTLADNNSATQIAIEYDEIGRKIKQIDPDLGEWQYDYDNFGQLVWQKDAKDQIVTMEYDNLGRITQRTENEGITQWSYDIGENAKGKLTRVWNDQGYERTHNYDEFGRPIEVGTTIDGDVTVIKTAYHHSTDRVAFIEYPSGLKIAKAFTNEGFPLSIRSTILDYIDRYLAAEAEALALAEIANQYKNDTATARQNWLDIYDAEIDIAENLETEIEADQRRYHRVLPAYNEHVRKQTDAINEAKHFERWGNSFREVAIEHQKLAIIHAHGAEIAINIIETVEPNWVTMRYPELGITEHDIISHMASLWGVTPATLGHAFNFGRNKQAGAAWAEALAGEAERIGNIAQTQINQATARYQQVANHIAVAKIHADNAEAYYEDHLKEIVDNIETKVGVANTHYQTATDAADEISLIDAPLKAKVDAAVNAQRQAEALKNYYENEGSKLHWSAISADAEGKVTEFTQGKHVSTQVTYQQNTGRLHGVFSESNPEPIELEAGQTIPSLSNRLTEFMADVAATQLEASEHAATSLEQLTRTQALISALDPNDPNLSPALATAAQAQMSALQVNESVFNVDYQLNNGITTLASSTLTLVQTISDDFTILEQAANEFTTPERHTNNILVYSSRVHASIASYHSQLKSLYEVAAQQQTKKANEVAGFGAIDADYLQEYADLGSYHSSISNQHQSRADAITIDDGSDASNPELYGLAKASFRQKRLIDRHADISNKRRRLNVALFAPLQHLNDASLEKHSQLETPLVSHLAENKMLGRSDRQRFEQLERLYRQRLAVLETDETHDQDLFASDTERKALYQYLAEVNAELGDMYTDMSDQSYWDGMFTGFAASLNDKSAVYSQLASNHNQIAANNQLLANKSNEHYDYGVLGNDDTILSDTYTWDDIGNLESREHGGANLTEQFDYDALNRLTRSAISGSSTMLYELGGNDIVTYEYDALGNLTYKSDIGTYTYGNNAGPHAVTAITGDATIGQKNTTYQYDANGNMTSGDGRLIDYTSFNKPKEVRGDGDTSDFIYGPERQLVKQVEQTGVVPKTTIYLGSQYQKIYDGYKTTEKYHLSTSNGATIAVIIDTEDEAPKTHYLHRDHLDSIVAISNETGHVVDRFFYDAFGKQLTAIDPSGNALYAKTYDSGLTDRGFTGHKTIQSGLIHMGGRVFDAAIGRFLSADPHIQFAGNLQNYNRYSYVNNNPLSFNDPSGYFISSVFKALKALFKKITYIVKKVINVIKKVVKFIKENLRVIIAVVVAIAVVYFTGGAATAWAASLLGTTTTATSAVILGGAITGAIAGGLSGLIMTGSLSGALKGAALGFVGGAIGGAVTASGAGNGIANALKLGKYTTSVGQGINAGLTGGIMGKITGGSFSKGFKNAVVAFGAFKGLDAVSGGAISRWGARLDEKGKKFFGTDSRDLVQFDDEGDLTEGRYDDHIHPDENLGLTKENGVLTGEITYACEGQGSQCSDTLAGWNKINESGKINIKFTKVDPSNARPKVTIGFDDKFRYGGHGYHKVLDTGSSYIYINPRYISSTTPLHELGHLLGFHHANVVSYSDYVAEPNSIMVPGPYKKLRINNFDYDEIELLLGGY
jgi:RHS repeat-associated protein